MRPTSARNTASQHMPSDSFLYSSKHTICFYGTLFIYVLNKLINADYLEKYEGLYFPPSRIWPWTVIHVRIQINTTRQETAQNSSHRTPFTLILPLPQLPSRQTFRLRQFQVSSNSYSLSHMSFGSCSVILTESTVTKHCNLPCSSSFSAVISCRNVRLRWQITTPYLAGFVPAQPRDFRLISLHHLSSCPPGYSNIIHI